MAEQDEQDDAVDKPAGSKKKLIIMGVAGIVGVAILAGAGLFFTGFFDEKKDEPVAEQSASDEGSIDSDEPDDESEGDEVEASTVIYHALMPPFLVNLSAGNIQVIKLAISVMASDQKVIDAVIQHDPVIRNNLLMILSSEDPEKLKTAKGKAALQLAIKEEINKVLDSMKVSSTVNAVFFTDLVMQ